MSWDWYDGETRDVGWGVGVGMTVSHVLLGSWGGGGTGAI